MLRPACIRHRRRNAWVGLIAICVLCLSSVARGGGNSFTADDVSVDFCQRLLSIADTACRARYDCSASTVAVERLTSATCACLQGAGLPDVAALENLLQATPSFACCAGNAILKRPDVCRAVEGD